METNLKEQFKKAKYIHFIGIGGIGISAIARLVLHEGKIVTGSDRSQSQVTDELSKAGAFISIGQKADNVPLNCDLVIYTVAVPEDNPELSLARHRGIPLMTYPQTLKVISEEKYTIAVSGTHGKTTVTAMIASILIEAGLDPTVLVGSLMKDPRSEDSADTNFITGSSDYFVVEADEYKKSFHNLYPKLLVINNLDEDHLDFYQNLQDIQNSFRVVAERVPSDGYIICNPQDPHVAPVIKDLPSKIIDYTAFKNKSPLKVPGEHNRLNAAAAQAATEQLGVKPEMIKKALENFNGTWRRFELKGNAKTGALVYDDYAHNPKKVQAVIQGARELFLDKKITIVFQPHLYSRTKHLFNEFVESFNQADEVLITPIYAAREVFDPEISSEMLVAELGKKGIKAHAVPTLAFAQEYLEKNTTSNDIILTVGAGDITTLGSALVNV